jgi:predicted RNA-binding Zn ribbon-like protein
LSSEDFASVADRFRRLRDALRALAAEITEDPRMSVTAPELTRSEALATLNGLARTRPELVWNDEDEPVSMPRSDGTPAEQAVALVAHQAVELIGGDRRRQLRACQGPNCWLFFLKHHSRREWCSAPCGNRARVQRHYRRHHTERGNGR